MDIKTVDRTGQDHLPPILKLITDPSYLYSRENETTESTSEGTLYTYTVKLSCEPFKTSFDSVAPKQSIEKSSSIEELVSQISSTTSSEMKSRSMSFSEKSSKKSKDTASKMPEYLSLPSLTSGSSILSNPTDSSIGTIPKSLPNFTYSSANMKSTRSGKFVMMVHVKFVLIHRDVRGRRVQSVFNDEFSSDTILENVIMNFHGLCTRQLTGVKFEPRVSYCVGELKPENSKPVNAAELKKTLAQLASSSSVVQLALVVNNAD
uniref:UBX domain-containing protein n=1 Tax=Caenorhabditis tropicalis TaxID=1561998 RepID=A0A1I7UQK8_9PELO